MLPPELSEIVFYALEPEQQLPIVLAQRGGLAPGTSLKELRTQVNELSSHNFTKLLKRIVSYEPRFRSLRDVQLFTFAFPYTDDLYHFLKIHDDTFFLINGRSYGSLLDISDGVEYSNKDIMRLLFKKTFSKPREALVTFNPGDIEVKTTRQYLEWTERMIKTKQEGLKAFYVYHYVYEPDETAFEYPYYSIDDDLFYKYDFPWSPAMKILQLLD